MSFRPDRPRPFSWPIFALASVAAAAVLVTLVAVPQWLSQQARWEQLRMDVGAIGKIAAATVDGDLHRRLLDPKNYSDDLYKRALEPLVRLHSADPDIYYLYTMVDRGGVAHFILDTASSPDLSTKHQLRASTYDETFVPRADDDWLEQLAAGKTYVNQDFEEDDYGTFLTALAPIYDSEGRYSGFVGVDFDTEYYLMREARFRVIAIATLLAALLLSLAIGYAAAVYHGAMQRRMSELRDSSLRDSLTGMFNRRGAMDVVKKDVERYAGPSAILIVDIDNLKLINDMRGHTTGDAVLALTSEAIRASLEGSDQCARLGDEFLIFAPGRDAAGGMELAREILGRLLEERMPLAGASFSVSMGIALSDGKDTDFVQMHRNADSALHQARAEGRNRISLYEPGVAEREPVQLAKVTA
ncbi:MAG TPA: GGDEF domain-containing protein [Methyloceanibacter sp.]|nr:GGDEF domain-containing protein [Methyloceanibacter sp.]